MHRMRSPIVAAGLIVALTCLIDIPAAAELIRPPAGRGYPDLAGAITGSQTYAYNASTATGSFRAINTPFLFTTGPASSDEVVVQPNLDGVRSQTLNLTLDKAGRLLSEGENSYALYGTVVLGGKTFRGLLLQGTPVAFGAQGGSSATFNVDVRVTGGALADSFGPELYMELHATADHAFAGDFSRGFRSTIDYSDTQGCRSAGAAPVPESTTLVVLLACGAGILFRRDRFRFPGRDLVAAT